MAKITKDTTLAELLENPKGREVLAKYNLPCLGCPFAKFEMENLKIGEVCKMYNIDLKNLLKELNKIYSE
jgi:hybrid cluster-associated redox disulfide protein